MPNQIDQNGIQIQTAAEIRAEILDGTADYPGMFQIYGPNINVGVNSPDGQMINIIVQAKLDQLEFIMQAFTSFDPDQAVGRVLDQRCAINGVQRLAGTRTTVNVNVTATQAVSISGLGDSPFTISDSAGNLFDLVDDYAFVAAGTQSLAFQAREIGAVEITPNSLTVIVSVTLGISAVNNPGGATATGTPEETDYALRIRRSRSVALPSKGYFEGLYGGLLTIEGVTSVKLLENTTNAADADGVPAHGIWAIVAGGTNAEIAQMIYVKRNAGCDMRGAVVVPITQVDGSTFDVLFDRPTSQDLWITFNAVAITGTIDVDYIRTQLLTVLSYAIGQTADASAIVALVKEIAPNAAISAEGVSDVDGGYAVTKTTTAVNYQFQAASVRIKINGTPGV